MGVRDINDVDVDIMRAMMRRSVHPDPVSLEGNRITVDGLLDERLVLMKAQPGKEAVPAKKGKA